MIAGSAGLPAVAGDWDRPCGHQWVEPSLRRTPAGAVKPPPQRPGRNYPLPRGGFAAGEYAGSPPAFSSPFGLRGVRLRLPPCLRHPPPPPFPPPLSPLLIPPLPTPHPPPFPESELLEE
jgi:hypothetical protein